MSFGFKIIAKIILLCDWSYDPVVGRFINADSVEYLDPSSVNGLNLYSYCGNNPVMNVDPSGNAWYEFWNWDWKLILDAVITTVTVQIVGAGIVSGSLPTIISGLMAMSQINNIVNSVYYNFISDGQSDLSPTSYSENNGFKYHTRWDRLDYTKKIMTESGNDKFNFNARMYYAEYSFHMHVWGVTRGAFQKDKGIFSALAKSAQKADVVANDPFADYNKEDKSGLARIIAYIVTAILGI